MVRHFLRVTLPLDAHGELCDLAIAERRSLDAQAEYMLTVLLRRRLERAKRRDHSSTNGEVPRAEVSTVLTATR